MNTLKSHEMDTMIPYEVVKGSTDHTLEVGDIIYLSEDRSLNGGGGWLNEDEWNNEGTNDFEVVETKRYVVDHWNGKEGLRYVERTPLYGYKEKWEELDQRLQKAKKELNKRLEANISDSEKERIKQKMSGLSIAIEYMREVS